MNYNKLPPKERKRHFDFQFNQPARQEELLIKKEIKRAEAEKRRWINQCEEAAALLKEMGVK